jgi:hypothetical protein
MAQNKNGGLGPPRLLPLHQPVRFPGYLSKESMPRYLQKNVGKTRKDVGSARERESLHQLAHKEDQGGRRFPRAGQAKSPYGLISPLSRDAGLCR